MTFLKAQNIIIYKFFLPEKENVNIISNIVIFKNSQKLKKKNHFLKLFVCFLAFISTVYVDVKTCFGRLSLDLNFVKLFT